MRPGDTIWLHGGVYRGGFTSNLVGRPDAPVVVRGAAGERVTIDTNPRDDRDNGLLLLMGADAVYRDFEVTCSHPTRVTQTAGSWPEDIRRGGIDVRGDRISVVNVIAHDLASGFGFWSAGEGGEISGCLIYNNGWQGPDRGHGHGIYAQNARGTKRIADNVLFHQFGYGIHCYGSENASLTGFEIEGNIAFENGCLSEGGNAPGILVGGGCPVARVAVRDNIVVAGPIRLGYPWGTTNEDVICTGNYCDEGLVLRDFRRAIVRQNTIIAHSNVVQLEAAERLLLSGLQWDENDLYVTDGRWGETAIVEEGKSQGLSFDDWRKATGCDLNSTFAEGRPDKLRVIVRPNRHEPGRAHIAVLNPQLLDRVEVDLSGVLANGQLFRIHSVKDVFGPAVLKGTFDGQPVRVPMSPVTPIAPVGLSDAELPVTEPGFAAFLVDATDGPIAAAEKPPLSLRPIDLRILGGDEQVPLAGVRVEITQGYGQDQKRFGPFKLDAEGMVQVRLPLGFFSLHLHSEKEWPYLPVERLWNERSRTTRPSLDLYVVETGIEKWLDGKRRDEGYEPPTEPDGPPRLTYTLLPACELLLRAVDADTGQGMPGVEFYTENAVGEDWGHAIHGENLGAKSPSNDNPTAAQTNRTDNDGNFRRHIGANAGYKYGVESAPAGYQLVEPRAEVEIDVTYGQPRAEQVFKFRRIAP